MREAGAPSGMRDLRSPGQRRCHVSFWEEEGARGEKQQGRQGEEAGGEVGGGIAHPGF